MSDSHNKKPDMFSSVWHRHPDTDTCLYTSEYEDDSYLIHDDTENDISFYGLKLAAVAETIDSKHTALALYQTKAGRLIGEIKVRAAQDSTPIKHNAHLFIELTDSVDGQIKIKKFFGMSGLAKKLYRKLDFEVKCTDTIE